MADQDVGVWVYAIIPADGATDRTEGLRGVADEPVRAVMGRDLAAVVGTVGLHEFRAEKLRHNLQDPEWMTAKARSHDAVISAVGRSGPVIPVRMATIYRDDWRVCQLLLKEQDDFAMALRRVSGREELRVTAYADPRSLAIQGDLIHSHSAERRPATVHVLRRRRRLAFQQEGYRLAAAEADRVHTTLTRCAVDAKRTPTDKALSRSQDRTILNGAYLVDDTVVHQFMQTVAALDRSTPRIRLEVTGPGPPYSFAECMVAI